MFKLNKYLFVGSSNEEVKPSTPKEVPLVPPQNPKPGVVPEKPILPRPQPEHIPKENPIIPKQLFCDNYKLSILV